MSLPKLKLPTLEIVRIGTLNPAEYNPRKMTKAAFDGLKASLLEFGLTEPIVVNMDDTIIGGHMRYAAIKEMWGEDQEVIVTRVNLNKKLEKKLNVTLNNLEIQGHYEKDKLAAILYEFKMDDNYDTLRLNAIEPVGMKDQESLKMNTEINSDTLMQDVENKCPKCGFEW